MRDLLTRLAEMIEEIIIEAEDEPQFTTREHATTGAEEMYRELIMPVLTEARASVLTDAGLLAQPFPTRAEIAEEPTGLPIGFDRWLKQVKAEVWDEGHNAGQHNEHEYRPRRFMANPYRKEPEA